MRPIKKNILASYQIISGLYGMWMILNVILMADHFTTLDILNVVLAFGFLISGILISYALFNNSVNAFRYFFWFSVVQVLQIHWGDFAFAFVSGAHIGISSAELVSFFFRPVFAYFELNFQSHADFLLEFNIAPLVLMIMFRKDIEASLDRHSSKTGSVSG